MVKLRDVRNIGRGITTKDVLEKRIFQGRVPLPSESGQKIDVSKAAKANGIMVPAEISPACEALLMDVPDEWKGALDYESRLYDLLFKVGEWLKNVNYTSEKPDPAIVMSTEKSVVFSLCLKMPHNEIMAGGPHCVNTAWFLCELRRVAYDKKPEDFSLTIALDPRHHG